MSRRLRNIFYKMKQRCSDEKCSSYKYYGGRGIKVCKEWAKSFENFKNWALKNGYKDTLSIERINVNGNYEPENCCWIEMRLQARNKVNTNRITAFSETKSLVEWLEDDRCDTHSVETLRSRMKRGLSGEEVVLGTRNDCFKIIEAFGEKKSLMQWSKDYRCKVRYGALQYRLDNGWKSEIAISIPPGVFKKEYYDNNR